MIEKTIIDFLKNKLSVKVSAEIPDGESIFVVLEKTGGSVEEHLCYSTVAIQSYANSRLEAAILNEEVKNVMLNIADEVSEITSVELNSDYNFTNTSTKKYRYQAVFNLVHYQ